MKHSFFILFLILLMFAFCSFNPKSKSSTNNINIERYELIVLRSNKVGKEFIIDLTGIEGCNKSRVKYLGVVSTQKGKKYKVLSFFHVHGNSCRGISFIKIYDTSNKLIGRYYVGMPDDLPDTLIGSNLIYSKAQLKCPLRKGTSISLLKGLPQSFYLPCSKTGGDMYSLSD